MKMVRVPRVEPRSRCHVSPKGSSICHVVAKVNLVNLASLAFFFFYGAFHEMIKQMYSKIKKIQLY